MQLVTAPCFAKSEFDAVLRNKSELYQKEKERFSQSLAMTRTEADIECGSRERALTTNEFERDEGESGLITLMRCRWLTGNTVASPSY